MRKSKKCSLVWWKCFDNPKDAIRGLEFPNESFESLRECLDAWLYNRARFKDEIKATAKKENFLENFDYWFNSNIKRLKDKISYLSTLKKTS